MIRHVGYLTCDCLGTVVKCQRSKMFKFHQFLDTTNSMSDGTAQSIYFKNLKEDLKGLWKDNVGIESPVNLRIESKRLIKFVF